ncbi:bromodomain-containing protein DDB_G0280777-like [Selaginella moellendorffii]|uniref:bromodomain-containing protein DDB_G0280777-like n=1 Tax=Selaginella moellendorffii TaxID=88036 RepID=UPI000D1D00CB|nr:bromodomain-containing protein DDB_G0280777-like [Selaginella moellendorffii]|eukprot:XP_024532413.1 bromodomain-containing protein DDB_G0280777-like [Selaginella moellendorffii]
MISYPIFTGGKTEDANQHLKQFDQIVKMNKQEMHREILFPYTLKGKALDWHNTLNDALTHDEKVTQFKEQFQTGGTPEEHYEVIKNFKQKSREGIQDYTRRFKFHAKRCKDLITDKGKSLSYIQGLKEIYRNMVAIAAATENPDDESVDTLSKEILTLEKRFKQFTKAIPPQTDDGNFYRQNNHNYNRIPPQDQRPNNYIGNYGRNYNTYQPRDGPHDNYQRPPPRNYNYDQEPYRNHNQRPPQAQGYNYNQQPAPQQDNRPRQPYQNANHENNQVVNNQAPRARPPAAWNVEVEVEDSQTYEEPAIRAITRQQYKYQQPDNLEEQDHDDELEIIPETEWKKNKKVLKAIQAELQAQDPETIKEHDKQSNNQETRSFTQEELVPVQQKEKFHVEEQAEARLKQNLVEDEQPDQIEQPAEEDEDLQWIKEFQTQELEVVLPKFCEQTEQKKNSVPEFDVEQAAAGQAGLEQKAVVKKKEEDVRQQRGVEVQNLVEQPSRGAVYPGQSFNLKVAGVKLMKRRGSVFLRSQDFEEAAQTYEEEEEPHEGAATHDAAMEQ